MSEHTNDELVNIVTTLRNDYQPEAIEAAEAEIRLREIDTSKIETIKAEIAQKAEEQKRSDANKVSNCKRLLNFGVDMIAFFILALVISAIYGILFSISDHDISIAEAYLIMAFAYLFYFIFMEYKFQKTIGKFITKTKVVNANGDKPELSAVVIRTFCRLIPFDRGSFLLFKSGFHDSISKTAVVKDRK